MTPESHETKRRAPLHSRCGLAGNEPPRGNTESGAGPRPPSDESPRKDLRRALLFATGGRYVVMGTGLISTIIIARLLTPSAFGISVLGTAVLAIAEALRELGSIAYLVQQTEMTLTKIRTVFSISLIVTLVITTLLMVVSEPLARLLGEPGIGRYIRIVALGYAIAPFAHPIYALLSRDMAFDTIAALDIATAIVNTVAAVWLVRVGFDYLGVAWAAVISGAVWTLAGFCVRRDISIYRPSLAEWRSVLAFGAYGSATALLYKASESLFYLILGGVLDARAVALCQRAVLLSQFPERVILAGVGAVALPAFSDHARRGKDLKVAYLTAVEHITAIQWPALILLGILAGPVVSLLLGPQWGDVVPITRIFVVAFAFSFPTSLNYPIQVAVGAIRQTLRLAMVQTVVSLATLAFAAQYGLRAVALTACVTIPFNVALSVRLVRKHIPFRWSDLARAMRRSAVVSGLSAAGPVAIAVGCDGHAVPVVMLLGAAAGSSAIGWICGLWLSGHPLFRELSHALASVFAFVTARLCAARLRFESLR
jgi:O-antigen/teichoic acid export membrane protein